MPIRQWQRGIQWIMRKAAKVVIGIVIAIVGFFVFVAIVASTVPIGTT
jgi:hypothetical protein